MTFSGETSSEVTFVMNDSTLFSAAPDFLIKLCNLICGVKSLRVNPCFFASTATLLLNQYLKPEDFS
jgi:hypothetical protein